MASFVSWHLFVPLGNFLIVFDVGSCSGGSSFYSCLIISSNDFCSYSSFCQFVAVLFHFVSFSLNVSALET